MSSTKKRSKGRVPDSKALRISLSPFQEAVMSNLQMQIKVIESQHAAPTYDELASAINLSLNDFFRHLDDLGLSIHLAGC